MFRKKDVDSSLLNRLSEYHDQLAKDYQESVLPQVANKQNKRLDFDFLFDWNVSLFKDLYTLTGK
ncbi:hypothetical protein [Oenococcus sicerae]|uniref:Uncharacterized protein n=1 Tax=Oenococcus sicerae TaxID=2203724 RepID=A0AAJ1RAD2_9LACO|nr:hypothetical protein [Oenococcus sicerae]MDN6900677.1 hypothetical protein [Oenococcus sicerae]